MKLKLTEAAERDLADLSAWLSAEASEMTARRVIGELLERFDSVLAFPQSGARSHPSRPPRRPATQPSHVLSGEGDLVVVIRVLHAARDTAAIAAAGGFGPGG